MKLMRSALFLTSCLASSLGATPTNSVDLAWPTTPEFAPDSHPTRSVPGHFSAAFAEDLVVLRGTQPVLVAEPGYQAQFVSWPVVANDVDRLPGLSGTSDHMISVGPAGLSESWVDASTGQIVSALIDASDDWLNARFVRVNDIDADGDSDIVGVHRDGELVLTKLRDANGWTDGSSLVLAGVAEGIELLDWTENQGASYSTEIAVASADGFAVYGIGGPPQQKLTETPTVDSTGKSMAVMPLADGRYGLATVTGDGSGGLVLTVLREVGGSAVPDQPPISIGSCGAVGLRSADVDGDGLWDVGYGSTANLRTMIYFSRPDDDGSGGAAPTSLEGDPWSRTLPDAWYSAEPGYADFDGDGHIDSLYPSTGALRLHRGPILSPYGSAGSTSTSVPAGGNFAAPTIQCAQGTIELSMSYPWLPSNHTGWVFEVAVWTRPDLASDLDAAPSQYALDVPGIGETDFQLTLPMPWTMPVASDASLCYVTVRAVLPDGQGGLADWGQRISFVTWSSTWAATDFDAVALDAGFESISQGCGTAANSGLVQVGRLPRASSGPLAAGGGPCAACDVQVGAAN